MNTRIQTADILKDFHKITGARVSLHDLNFHEIAAYPKELSPFCAYTQKFNGVRETCLTADAKAFEKVSKSGEPYTYKCHCGLIEMVAPIYNYGTLSGYFMMGQINDDNADSLNNIKHLCKRFFKSKDDLDKYCEKIPTLPSSKLNNYINILEVIAEFMTETNRLTAKDRDLAEAIKIYINRNLSQKLSSKLLCETFGCSRTTLMNAFKLKYGVTIGKYLNDCRIKHAEEILSISDKSIKFVAIECGFSDQNYFTKAFIKMHGCTPTEFRKINSKQV